MNWEFFIDWLSINQWQTHWLLHVALTLTVTFSAIFLISRLFQRIELQLEKTTTTWDNALLNAARRPLHYFIWAIGTATAAQVLSNKLDVIPSSIIAVFYKVSVIILLTWFLIRLVKEAEDILASPTKTHKPIDLTTITAISKLLKASLFIISSLVLLQTLGFSISGVLAFGGIGGIAVGFAAKDLLANFFGGLMIYLDRPFSVGDWVRSPDKEIEGTIEKVGWRQTRVRTFDKRPLYIPNSTFSVIAVENPSRMTHRRIYEKIGIRYRDSKQLPNILADIKAMLTQHPDIDETQTMIVNFDKFGDSALEFFIYTFTKTTNWIEFHNIKQDILLQVLTIISKHKAEVSFPTQTLHIQKDNPLLD
ncbi:mechanosensitive ion channel family protein [Marinomonas agarivorans]|nr:mechanosensitive ion channel family protein [Marinomonas agarivorans]